METTLSNKNVWWWMSKLYGKLASASMKKTWWNLSKKSTRHCPVNSMNKCVTLIVHVLLNLRIVRALEKIRTHMPGSTDTQATFSSQILQPTKLSYSVWKVRISPLMSTKDLCNYISGWRQNSTALVFASLICSIWQKMVDPLRLVQKSSNLVAMCSLRTSLISISCRPWAPWWFS